MRSGEPHSVPRRFVRPTREYTEGPKAFSILIPCSHFLLMFAIRLKPQEKKSSCTYFEWWIRFLLWVVLIAYGFIGVLTLFTLFTHIKKGTTLLSSEGLHVILGYETAVILLSGIFSQRRRAHLNEYLVRLDKTTRVKELPVARFANPVLYTMLTILFVHSAALTFTTSMLQNKIAVPENRIVPLPVDNSTSAPEGKIHGGEHTGLNEGGLMDIGGMGLDGTADSDITGSVPFNAGGLGQEPSAGGGGHDIDMKSPADAMHGSESADEGFGELNRRRRRRRRTVLRHPDDVDTWHLDVRGNKVIEMVVIADRVEETELERDKLHLELGAENVNESLMGKGDLKPDSRGGRLSRVRRGLIDTAIDDSIDDNELNFIELFRPFSPIINGIRYLLIKNIIYLSATLISCFCIIIRQKLLQINEQLEHKVRLAELSTELLADVRQAYSQCISVLRDIERNFSLFCFLWNWLVFLETLYIGRMLYEMNATNLYELPTTNVILLMTFYNATLAFDLVLLTIFQIFFTEAVASVRAQALRTIDIVTIGTASIPPNRIEAHQQAELLVSIATIQDPGLTAWDIASHGRALGYSVLAIAYVVLFAYLQFLRDGKWRTIFGNAVQEKGTTPPTSESVDDLNIGGDLHLDLDGQDVPAF